MSPFCSSDFSLLREEKTCCLSCGVVDERRASVGSRWATRGGNARSMASRPSALSTGCPHAPKGARRSAGLVHKSTARRPALAASSSGRRARGGLERSPPGMVRRRLVGRPRPLLRLRRVDAPAHGLAVLQRNRLLALGQQPRRQLAAFAQHRHRAVEGLARRHLRAAQAIPLAPARHLVLAALEPDRQVLRQLAPVVLAKDQVQLRRVAQNRAVGVFRVPRRRREAPVEVRHELRQIGVARRHVGDAAHSRISFTSRS